MAMPVALVFFGLCLVVVSRLRCAARSTKEALRKELQATLDEEVRVKEPLAEAEAIQAEEDEKTLAASCWTSSRVRRRTWTRSWSAKIRRNFREGGPRAGRNKTKDSVA